VIYDFFFISDFQLDPQLVKSCKRDVPKFCKTVEPGEGKIVECLKQLYEVCFDDLLFTLNHLPLDCLHEQLVVKKQ